MTESFKINQWTYYRETSLLSCDGLDNITLDPKVAALLEFFIAQPNSVLSRDDLLTNVWPGIIVSDNTVSWAISQLRKALGDKASSPLFIKTLPKKGYQFIAEVKLIATAPDSTIPAVELVSNNSIQTVTANKFHKIVLLAGTVIFLVLIGVFNILKSAEIALVDPKPITQMQGLEESAELSPDQQFLVFRHKAYHNNKFSLYLKPMFEDLSFELEKKNNEPTQRVKSNRDQVPYSISKDSSNYHHVIWGNNNHKLFAARSLKGTGCHIVELILSPKRQKIIDENIITTCASEGRTKLVSIDDNTLYFTDKRANSYYQVYRFTIGDDRIEEITNPQVNGLGDHFIASDLTKSKLLILRHAVGPKTKFISYSIKDNKTEELMEQPSFYYTAAWGRKPDTLWLNWSNENLIEYDLQSQTGRFLLQNPSGWNYNVKPLSESIAIFNVSDGNERDILVLNDEKLNHITLPSNEFLPTLSLDGELMAYLSNRSGLNQIWLVRNGAHQQLTNLNKHYEFNDFIFSNDSRWLYGATQQSIGKVDILESKYVEVFQGKDTIHSLSIDSNQNIAFISSKLGGNALYYLPRNSLESQKITIDNPLFSSIDNIQFFNDELYVSLADHQALYKLNVELNSLSLVYNFKEKVRSWRLSSKGLHWLNELTETSSSANVTINDLETHQIVNSKTLTTPIVSRFSITKAGNNQVFSTIQWQESNLRLINIIEK